MNTRKQLSAILLSLTLLLLLLSTLTPLFTPLLKTLPTHAHLLLHFLAHAIATIAAAHLLAPSVPPEAVCAASIALAFLIELAQAAFTKDRLPSFTDFVAATIGSFAPFAMPKDGRIVPPSWQPLAAYLGGEEDDEEEDGHRVGSWAV